MNLRRVLVLADESANWIIAGLRQLDRIALTIDEVAIKNRETGPVLLCIYWRPDIGEAHRWQPANPRLTHVTFAVEPDAQPYDLIVNTRLFLYRNAVPQLLARSAVTPMGTERSWENYFRAIESRQPTLAGAWEYVAEFDEIEGVERRFLRCSGKSQDGLVSRYVNRPLSREVTRFLLRTEITPNLWSWLIFPIPVIAALTIARGTYWSIVWGLVLFQVFSILDGCDGEIARAKFLESERGRQLDDLFDVLSNILLVLGLGIGLSRAHPRFNWLFILEGIVAASLIAISEWLLARTPAEPPGGDSLGGALYPRHRALVARSGLLVLGEKFASRLIQLTKRDVAVLFFVLLALLGAPAVILHVVFLVTAVTLGLALRARLL